MKKISVLLLFLFISAGFVSAQSHTFENVARMGRKNSGYIMENDNVVGTYYFYLYDKVDKKTSSYFLQILDNNLAVVKEIIIERPSNSYMLEMVYNGNAFMMMFYTAKGNLDLVTYDKAGKKLGEKNFEDLSKMEKYNYVMSQTNETENSTIYPLGNNGFIRQAYTKNDKPGYRLEAYDNNLNQTYVLGSDESSKLFEGGDIIYASDKHVGLNVIRKKSKTTKQYDQFFQLIDSKTGTVKFEKALKDNGADLSMLNCMIDEASEEIITSGEYFAPGDDQGKDKSQGMYFLTLDFKGDQKELKKLSWNLDFAKMKVDEDEKKSKKNMSIYFHKIIRTNNGQWFAIGEQYKKQVSGMGVASNILGGPGPGVQSAFSVFVYNMVVIQFDKSFNITSIETIEKKRSEVEMPQGAAYYSSAYLAKYVAMMGGFDYSFTTIDKAKDEFNSLYIDLNKKDSEGKKSDVMIGAISYKDNKIAYNRFPLNKLGNSIWFAPAKPGYVAVSEYFKKKKMIVTRLEKVNY